MPANINAIGRSSSGRLTEILSANLADQVINEMHRNGEYPSWEDLKNRNFGIGPKKIEKLQKNNFVIKPTARAATVNNEEYITPSEEAGNSTFITESLDLHPETQGLPTLRLDVNSMSDQVWRHRQNQDLYTKLTKNKVVNNYPQVDHIWEIQLLNKADAEASEGQGMAARTRDVRRSLQNIVNGTTNLNVTTRDVNQKKKGPFTIWLHRENSTLEDIARESAAGKDLMDKGHWNRITGSIVKTYQDMEEEQAAMRNKAAKEHVGRVMESLNKMLEKMDI